MHPLHPGAATCTCAKDEDTDLRVEDQEPSDPKAAKCKPAVASIANAVPERLG